LKKLDDYDGEGNFFSYVYDDNQEVVPFDFEGGGVMKRAVIHK